VSSAPSRVEQPILESRVLRDNPLGDPYARCVTVYLPPGYDDASHRRFPALYLLSGHGSTGPGLLNWRPWDVTIQGQLDALAESTTIGPLIVVMPDMWTRFGGSQYIDSAGMGRYEAYLIEEIVPFVDRTYRTLPERDHRGVLGRSTPACRRSAGCTSS
jgi:enterochelin esterase-like enzyme